jgi:hypothetical protein
MISKFDLRSAIVEVSGGFGNQLFQMSAAIYLRENGVAVCLNLAPNEVNGVRKTEIEDFASSMGISSLRFATKNSSRLLVRISRRVLRRLKKNVVREDKEFGPPPLTHSHKKMTFCGYWQCTEVARHIKERAISYWSIDKTSKQNTIALHVRRGDYMHGNNPNYHGILSGNYFLEATKHLRSQLGDLPIVIYTDSPDIVQTEKWLDFLTNYSFAPEMNTVATFKAIAGSTAIVGSNSTFSWWAAYLSGTHNNVFPTLWQVGLEFPETLRFEGMITLNSSFI